MANHFICISGAATVALTSAVTGSAFAGELHVPGRYSSIQAAVDAAVAGDEVIIAPGVYNETIDIVGKTDITLRGVLGPESTILDGTDLGRTTIRVDQGASVAIERITLRNSDSLGGTWVLVGSGPFPQLRAYVGGALFVNGASAVAVHRCIVRDNSLDVPNDTLSRSVGAGIGVIQGSSVNISDSQFVNNSLPSQVGPSGLQDGAAVYVDIQSSLHVSSSEFRDNNSTSESQGSRGGAISFEGTSSGRIVQSVFTSNRGGRGGAIHNGKSDLILLDCEFDGNISTNGNSRGGAISSYGEGSLTVDNCLFTNNFASWDGSAIDVIGPTLLLANTQFCGNVTAVDVFVGGESPPWIDGGGNTFADTCPAPLPGDVNADGVVDVSDLLALLGTWGNCPRAGDCPADLNDDGLTDVSDLLILLSNWS